MRKLVLIIAATAACGDKVDPLGPLNGGPQVTWYRDVLPIVQDNCLTCHRTGEIGPFSMETYTSAAEHAYDMASKTTTREMPPWMPSNDCQPMREQRGLSDSEISVFLDWYRGGVLEGDPGDAPPAVGPDEVLEVVDFEGDIGDDYTPQGDASHPDDDYHCFIVDHGLTQNEYLVAYEVAPGARELVHHVILFQASAADAHAADSAEGTPTDGWTCFGGPGVGNNDSLGVGAWAPGTPVTRYPLGTGIRLDVGNVLVVQVHYNLKDRTVRPDRTALRLQYAAAPVIEAAIYPIADFDFTIPPRLAGRPTTYTTGQNWPIPANLTIWGTFPHMHLLGRSIAASITDTNGNQVCLVDVPKWNFHWQQFYFYDLPQGLAVDVNSFYVTCTWDKAPDRSVTWGESTQDEMCLVGIYATQ